MKDEFPETLGNGVLKFSILLRELLTLIVREAGPELLQKVTYGPCFFKGLNSQNIIFAGETRRWLRFSYDVCFNR